METAEGVAEAVEVAEANDSEVVREATPAESTSAEVPAWQKRLLAVGDLPEGVRKQLAQLTEGSEKNASGEVEPQISLGRVLDLLEGALPFSMRLGEGEVTVAEHPSGESFFGGSKELSDADAERLAREQLERCGLLRK